MDRLTQLEESIEQLSNASELPEDAEIVFDELKILLNTGLVPRQKRTTAYGAQTHG